MKDKLKPNMYVRTKDGKIFDCYVNEQMGKPIYYPKRSKTNGYIDWNELYKKSENIIDILEVGDVIIDKEGHKYPINYEFETDYNDEYKSYEITIDDHITLFFKDGLSIVTKEQFESMEYRLGDDK